MQDIVAHLTASATTLFFRLLVNKSVPDKVTTALDEPSIGHHVIHSIERHLGVSAEARELLALARQARLGESADLVLTNGAHGKNLHWFGSPDGFIAIDRLVVRGMLPPCIEVPNEVPFEEPTQQVG